MGALPTILMVQHQPGQPVHQSRPDPIFSAFPVAPPHPSRSPPSPSTCTLSLLHARNLFLPLHTLLGLAIPTCSLCSTPDFSTVFSCVYTILPLVSPTATLAFVFPLVDAISRPRLNLRKKQQLDHGPPPPPSSRYYSTDHDSSHPRRLDARLISREHPGAERPLSRPRLLQPSPPGATSVAPSLQLLSGLTVTTYAAFRGSPRPLCRSPISLARKTIGVVMPPIPRR